MLVKRHLDHGQKQVFMITVGVLTVSNHFCIMHFVRQIRVLPWTCKYNLCHVCKAGEYHVCVYCE